MMTSTKDIQRKNWDGYIPVMISLAESSLSAVTMPSPLYRMVSRQSYLHISLENEIKSLYRYAPVVGFRSVVQDDDEVDNTSLGANTSNQIQKEEDTSQDESTYPICWFEDIISGIPLRWHFFTGVLFDILQSNKHRNKLPWKLRVHFTSYPSSILPLTKTSDVNKTEKDAKHALFHNYLNSLKQALHMQHATNKVSHNMSKNSHLQLWDGITMNQFDVYRQVDEVSDVSKESEALTLHQIPIRLMLDARPAMSRPCKISDPNLTLKGILQEWVPDIFQEKKSFRCIVQGIDSCLDYSILDLWKTLCHPDKFLYVIVKTTE